MAAHAEYNGRLTLFAAAQSLLRVCAGFCLLAAVFLYSGSVGAQETARVETIQGEGYGRLIFTFPSR
ncbi:MAG: hypothetical protein R3D43_00165 [Tepidamorphaceae bacterium]